MGFHCPCALKRLKGLYFFLLDMEMTTVARPAIPDGLVVFLQQHCPFCTRVRDLLASFALSPIYIDVDDPQNADLYHEAVKTTGHSTVPLVMYHGTLVGGCDDTCISLDNGDFQRLLDLPSISCVPQSGNQRRDMPAVGLFNFPALVNIWVVRATAFQVFALSIIVVVFGVKQHPWACWVSLGLTCDFLIRLFMGGTSSPMGSIAACVTTRLHEDLVPGPPKQFAIFVGTAFCAVGTILFQVGSGSHTSSIGGSVLIGTIAVFSGLECFIDFCMGCYVFSFLVKWGIVKSSIYQPCTDSYTFAYYAIRDWKDKRGWASAASTEFVEGSAPAAVQELIGWRRRYRGKPIPHPVKVHSAVEVGQETTAVDIVYNFPKFDDTVREEWHFKYLQNNNFGIILGIGGFAMVCKAAVAPLDAPRALWYSLAIASAVLFGLLFIMYALRAMLYPKKVLRDLQHPIRRFSFAVPLICPLIFAYLANGENSTIEEVLFWISATVGTVFFIVSLAVTLKSRNGNFAVGSFMLLPIALMLLLSMTLMNMSYTKTASYNYQEAAQWYFGFGFLSFILVLAGNVFFGVVYSWSHDPERAMIAIWMACCFIVQISYNAVMATPAFDLFAYSFFALGCMLLLLVVYLIFPGNFLFRGRFDMMNWSYCFSVDVMALSGISYYTAKGHEFSRGIAWTFIVIAAYANVACFFHTVKGILDRRWPGPHPKWGMLAFNKYFHEAMKHMAYRLEKETEREITDPKSNSARRLVEFAWVWVKVMKTHHVMEDKFLFNELKAVNRAQVAIGEKHHEKLNEQLTQLDELLRENKVEEVRRMLPKHMDHVVDLMQWECDHLAPLVRKGLNGQIAMRTMQRMFENIDMEDLERFVVTAVRFLPMHMYRMVFVKALVWGLPERCEHIGTWLYRGLAADPLGDIKCAMLFDDVPEIVPRNASIFWSYHL